MLAQRPRQSQRLGHQHNILRQGRAEGVPIRPTGKRESWSYLLQKPCSNRPAPEWDRLPDESGEVSDKGGVALSARKAVSMVTNETDLRSMSAFGSARANRLLPAHSVISLLVYSYLFRGKPYND